ncbi:MAG: DNA polymerase III subunit alpha [Cytophagales bacterium]|nr:DNA polymerase III subunit alpha [Bernardetiaceae bacterium]MDW8210268.1 DNA polymerase III subunit alpha [Cytophagales bacterium]
MQSFSHLHCHTQFSLLDGAASISGMMKKALADGMKAVAITDHGNMFGVFKFVAEAEKHGIKPIVGCEFYLVEDRHRKEFGRDSKDVRYHQLLLAKNPEGYRNLSKLCSLGYIEGFYGKYPRIDKKLIAQYHKGLIATSCCIGAEIPQAILHKGPEEAEKLLRWWIDLFGEDYYIELQRHHIENIDHTGMSQEEVNQILLGFARKYNLKIIATNDSHYIDRKDAEPHDILLCINTGEKKSTPIGEGKGFRFGFPNREFFFKTQAEMNQLFSDLPQALDNTNEIVDKVEKLKLKRDILLPNFPLPEGFRTQDEYLRYLTFEGAKKRYSTITPLIEERLSYELEIIQKMGFSGYFLIVQDFIAAARRLGVSVGPGRGSAAGSAVAYCIGITNIDPIQYNLLFERFLNPERVSMPDIDVDFDDVGRQRVIDYVVEKYGRNQVAQIITYGSMAAKMSVKDVGRVLDFPLEETNQLAKLIPEKPGITLAKAYEEVPELAAIRKGNDMRAEILKNAEILEGSVRNTGIHAAGIIIAPNDLTEYIPVCTAKESNLLIAQFEGKVIEEAGMLKMDFLGLKTLTIIQDALKLIEKNHNKKIDIDNIPLDDPKTYQLYQRGETIGTFQFESEGMRTYLRELKPTNIEDLIAMNALYRPGPMQFIPNYIARKHGREKVEYPHPLLEPILNYTFGIMVYQEQIMQTAQVLAGYSLGGADLLRRAMGKKDKEKMAKEKDKFIAGAKKLHNIPESKAEEIFGIMEKFAEYGFNRSHSAAYSILAYQTAYLKAHYPAEYMAAVLTHSMGKMEEISLFLEECRRMELTVLGPDINESDATFSVNKKGQIRFGLAAIKGTGEAAVEAIIQERTKNGPFKSMWDFAQRINLRLVNKKTFESLAYAGAFDCFSDIHRAQYFYTPEGEGSGIEKIMRYGQTVQALHLSAQASLFGSATAAVPQPKMPSCPPWTELEKLKFEKEVVGFYLSGHPLDPFSQEVKAVCTCSLAEVQQFKNQEIKIAGVVTAASNRTSKNGKPFGIFSIEDYNGTLEIALFGEDYYKYRDWFSVGNLLFLKGKVQERYGQANSWEFRPTQVMPLQEVREKMTRSLEIHIYPLQLSPQTIATLHQVIQQHKGSCPLQVVFFDYVQQIQAVSTSRKYSVSPTNELLKKLTELNLSFRLVM